MNDGTGSPGGADDIDATWHSIVAALEEDVRRSELEAQERARVAPVPDSLAPSQVRLPAVADALVLPPVSAMPAVPADVVERIRALQSRIDDLTRQLQDEIAFLRPALTALNGPRNRLVAGVEPPAAPHFFDTTA